MESRTAVFAGVKAFYASPGCVHTEERCSAVIEKASIAKTQT